MIYKNLLLFLFIILYQSLLTIQNKAYLTPYGRLYCDSNDCYKLNGERFSIKNCKKCRPITENDGTSIYIESSDNNNIDDDDDDDDDDDKENINIDNTLPVIYDMEFDRTPCYYYPPTNDNYKISYERTNPCQKLKYYQYYYYSTDFYLTLPEKKCYRDKKNDLILFLTDKGWCDPSCNIIKASDSNANCEK
ncbi:hypothetical protein BCR32DRAFT_294503 [Anaeromyces robustus]|uniref:Uncharacterized protein n=1 Tax=Anaeromyces robustus TaxID=1754192 RepID=A0A1Y1X0N4_9FUNG|nr:hypothetical protein BCR32DRAFT_294503 [Anaeromyces robustus]|eukprot:ORX79367.1 hypothetical protein BCR32DRAFT_294503 [Anaeromyces robustus]